MHYFNSYNLQKLVISKHITRTSIITSYAWCVLLKKAKKLVNTKNNVLLGSVYKSDIYIILAHLNYLRTLIHDMKQLPLSSVTKIMNNNAETRKMNSYIKSSTKAWNYNRTAMCTPSSRILHQLSTSNCGSKKNTKFIHNSLSQVDGWWTRMSLLGKGSSTTEQQVIQSSVWPRSVRAASVAVVKR